MLSVLHPWLAGLLHMHPSAASACICCFWQMLCAVLATPDAALGHVWLGLLVGALLACAVIKSFGTMMAALLLRQLKR
jgi:hypothetical protein